MTTPDLLILNHGYKMPAPRPGVEIVALGGGDPIALKGSRGLTLSERMFGKYRTFVEVDIAEKHYEARSRLPSEAATMFFDATVLVRYRVTNSAKIVKHAVADGKVATWRLLEPALQKSTRSAKGDDRAAAEKLAEAAAETVRSQVLADDELGLMIVAVTVQLDLQANIRNLLDTVERETLISRDLDVRQRLDKKRRKGDEEMLKEGPRAWLAHLMRDDPNIIREVLNQMAVAEKERYDNDMKLLLKMLDSGDIESHEIPKNVKDDFIRSILQRASAGETLQLFNTNPNAAAQKTDAAALPQQKDEGSPGKLKPERE